MASHRRPKQPSRTRVTVLTADRRRRRRPQLPGRPRRPQREADQERGQGARSTSSTRRPSRPPRSTTAPRRSRRSSRRRSPTSRTTSPAARGSSTSCATASVRWPRPVPHRRHRPLRAALPLRRTRTTTWTRRPPLDQLSSQAGRGAEEDRRTSSARSPSSARRPPPSSRTSPTPARSWARRRRRSRASSPRRSKLLNSPDRRGEGGARRRGQPAPAAASERVDLGNDAAGLAARRAPRFAAAQSKIGSPYVYGATGPSSFDCSGLTSWAYAQAGVSIPRTSQAQANAGTRIYSQSRAQARRPGHLLRRPAPRRPLRGQRPGAARAAHRHGRALRVDRATCRSSSASGSDPPSRRRRPRVGTRTPPERANRGDSPLTPRPAGDLRHRRGVTLCGRRGLWPPRVARLLSARVPSPASASRKERGSRGVPSPPCTRPGSTGAAVGGRPAAVLSVAAGRASAAAVPADRRAARRHPGRVDRLYEEAEKATEALQRGRRARRRAARAGRPAQDRDRPAAGAGQPMREALGSLAGAQYRAGGLDPSLALLFSDDPDELPRQGRRARPDHRPPGR